MRKTITELARRIKKARLEKLMSQQQLGKLLGISDKTISAYESGRAIPPLPTLVKMCSVLKKDLNYFTSNTVVRKEQAEKLRLQEFEKSVEKIQKNVVNLKKKMNAIEKLLIQRK